MAKKRKILVVDDELDFLELLRIRLAANKYDVVTALSGPEALAKIKTEKPDAVLLDILMPGMDGLDVLRRIRKEDEDLPVFIITAFSNEERFRMANKLNASGFILKTGDIQQEIENITSALEVSVRYKK